MQIQLFLDRLFLPTSLESISGTCCWNRRCCPISVQFLATYPFFSRTVHPPADRARETVALLQREVLSFIAANLWPPNSPGFNPVDYKVWGMMQDRVYWAKVRDVNNLKQRLIGVWSVWTVWSKASSMTPRSTSCVYDFVPVSMQKGPILNSLCNLQSSGLTSRILTCTELKGHCFVLVSGYVC